MEKNLITVAETSRTREIFVSKVLFGELREQLGDLLDEIVPIFRKITPWGRWKMLVFFLGSNREETLQILEGLLTRGIRVKFDVLKRMSNFADSYTGKNLEDEAVRDFIQVITNLLRWIEISQDDFTQEEIRVLLKMTIRQLTKLAKAVRKDMESGLSDSVFDICSKWMDRDATGRIDSSEIIKTFMSKVLN